MRLYSEYTGVAFVQGIVYGLALAFILAVLIHGVFLLSAAFVIVVLLVGGISYEVGLETDNESPTLK